MISARNLFMWFLSVIERSIWRTPRGAAVMDNQYHRSGIIVLGGSITATYPFFESSMKMKLNQYICPVPAEHLTIVLPQLGDNAGFIGAACLAMNHELPKSTI